VLYNFDYNLFELKLLEMTEVLFVLSNTAVRCIWHRLKKIIQKEANKVNGRF